jgi:hypothetical protein
MREVELTTHQIREIYEQKQREYHINDARNHCDDYLEAHGIEIAFTQGDYEVMAERFEIRLPQSHWL